MVALLFRWFPFSSFRSKPESRKAPIKKILSILSIHAKNHLIRNAASLDADLAGDLRLAVVPARSETHDPTAATVVVLKPDLPRRFVPPYDRTRTHIDRTRTHIDRTRTHIDRTRTHIDRTRTHIVIASGSVAISSARAPTLSFRA